MPPLCLDFQLASTDNLSLLISLNYFKIHGTLSSCIGMMIDGLENVLFFESSYPGFKTTH